MNRSQTNKIIFIIVTLCLFSTKYGISQKKNKDFPSYSKTKQAPFWINKNPAKLSIYLTKGYTNDSAKAIAIATWICKKVKYGIKGIQNGRVEKWSSKKVLRRRRRAICEEYSTLFKEMCEAVGIEAIVVPGYTILRDHYPGDTLYRADHTWNVAKINGKWQLFDITWAAGTVKPRIQLFRRSLYFLFSISFRQKWKYVRGTNPYYCFTPPQDFSKEHIPLLESFQLIENPIKIDQFTRWDTTLTSQMPELKQTISIENFNNQSEVSNWKSYTAYGPEVNPKNHRVVSIYRTYVLDSIYRKEYNTDSKHLTMPKNKLLEYKDYGHETDSFIRMTIEDNNKEYAFYLARSITWKDSIKTINKRMRQQLSALNKRMTKQKSTLKRLKSKNKRYINYSKRKRNIVKPHHIRRIRRPRKESLAQPKLALLYLNKADSKRAITNLLIQTKDSILNSFKNPYFPYAVENETTVSYELQVAQKTHKNLLRSKLFWSIDYYPWEPINITEKPWLQKSIIHLDSLNKTITDSMVFTFYYGHQDAYNNIKAYYKNSKLVFKRYKLAKKNSIKNLNEERLFLEYMSETSSEYERYISQLKHQTEYKRIYSKLRKSRTKIRKLRSQLSKESRFESQRHRNYKTYRAEIKNRENNRMKFLIKRQKEVNKAIRKTESFFDKSDFEVKTPPENK